MIQGEPWFRHSGFAQDLERYQHRFLRDPTRDSYREWKEAWYRRMGDQTFTPAWKLSAELQSEQPKDPQRAAALWILFWDLQYPSPSYPRMSVDMVLAAPEDVLPTVRMRRYTKDPIPWSGIDDDGGEEAGRWSLKLLVQRILDGGFVDSNGNEYVPSDRLGVFVSRAGQDQPWYAIGDYGDDRRLNLLAEAYNRRRHT